MKKVPQRSSHSDKIDNHRFPICSPEPNHLQIRSGNNPSTHIHLPESPLPIIFVYCAINYAGEMLINKYYDSSEQEEKKNEYYIQELQKYIHEKNISSKDADQLNRWVEQQKVLHVRVYKGDIVVFESEYPEQKYHARRLFVFGTGETQNTVAEMIKRVFLQTKVFFVTLYGKSELKMTINGLGEQDVMIFISVSGENEMAIEAMKTLKNKGTYIVSITKLNNNTLARLADKSLYVITDQYKRFNNRTYETTSAYFNTVEILFLKYLDYLDNLDE